MPGPCPEHWPLHQKDVTATDDHAQFDTQVHDLFNLGRNALKTETDAVPRAV